MSGLHILIGLYGAAIFGAMDGLGLVAQLETKILR